jgi:hypothetical protein
MTDVQYIIGRNELFLCQIWLCLLPKNIKNELTQNLKSASVVDLKLISPSTPFQIVSGL